MALTAPCVLCSYLLPSQHRYADYLCRLLHQDDEMPATYGQTLLLKRIVVRSAWRRGWQRGMLSGGTTSYCLLLLRMVKLLNVATPCRPPGYAVTTFSGWHPGSHLRSPHCMTAGIAPLLQQAAALCQGGSCCPPQARQRCWVPHQRAHHAGGVPAGEEEVCAGGQPGIDGA